MPFPAASATPASQADSYVPVAAAAAHAVDPASWAFVPAEAVPTPVVIQDPAIWAPAPTAAATAPMASPDPASFSSGPATYIPPPATYAPVPASYTPGTPSPVPATKKSNTLLKVIIACVVILFAGGALALAGLWYAAQKINAKAHAVAAQVLGGAAASSAAGQGGLLSGSSSSGAGAAAFTGDPCRFLTKAEVSQAVGLPIIRTDAKDGGCSYIAKGDPADVTAKHASALLGSMGADAQTQKMAQKFAGAMFAQQEASDKDLSAQAATGEIPVLGISFTSGNAAMEMKMNRGAFARLRTGGTAAANPVTGDLTGIGDDAYVAGASMILVRKGNVVAHFTYVSCPCSTDNIKPLAQMVAGRL
jgi:hypothetical protein